MQEQPEKVVGEHEAAAILDLTPSALRKWRQLRKGPAFIRISPRCVKYRLSDLESFLIARRVTPGGSQIHDERALSNAVLERR